MDVAARVTSNGRVTVPKAVRDALGIRDGDDVVFRIVGNRAQIAKTPALLSLVGTIQVPAARRTTTWDHAIRRARATRSRMHR